MYYNSVQPRSGGGVGEKVPALTSFGNNFFLIMKQTPLNFGTFPKICQVTIWYDTSSKQ